MTELSEDDCVPLAERNYAVFKPRHAAAKVASDAPVHVLAALSPAGGADGGVLASVAGGGPDAVMEDAPALGGRGRRDTESQDSSPRPGGPSQATKRARVSAADDNVFPEEEDADAAGGGAVGGVRRSERLAALGKGASSRSLDQAAKQQREAMDILTGWVLPQPPPAPAFTENDLHRVAAALSHIFKDADTRMSDFVISGLALLIIQAQQVLPSSAKARAEELFKAPPAGDGPPPGIECLRRLTALTGKWPRETTALFPGREPGLNEMWKAIKEHSYPGGGKNLTRAEREHHMFLLVKALYDTTDVEVGKRRAAVHMAYLLGTRPVAGPNGKTEFFRQSREADKRPDNSPWSPLLWTASTPQQMEIVSRNALAQIPLRGENFRVGRPELAHFEAVHLQLDSLSYGSAADYGEAFPATLDPPGCLPLRNAVVRFTPKDEWHIVVTPANEAEQRFTKCLNVEWTQTFHKVKRVRRSDGTWRLETDTGERFTIHEFVKESRIFKECLRFFRTEYGWSEGVAHDPVDFAIQVLRATGLILLEQAPEQKAAVVVSGAKDAGKTTLLELLIGNGYFGNFLSTPGSRKTNSHQVRADL